jgi:hypothetical protein
VSKNTTTCRHKHVSFSLSLSFILLVTDRNNLLGSHVKLLGLDASQERQIQPGTDLIRLLTSNFGTFVYHQNRSTKKDVSVKPENAISSLVAKSQNECVDLERDVQIDLAKL